jgi:hypothetical protein
VAGDFGTVATGYLQTTGYDFANKFDPTSGSSVSPLGNITKGGNFLIGSAAGAKRAQRALAYISPDMGGVTVAVNYATDIAGAASLGDLTQASAAVSPKVTALLISATYTGGSLAVGGVYAKTGTAVSTGDTTEYSLGASYDLSVVKLSGTYQSSSTGAAGVAGSANTAASLGATAPVGSGTVLVSYAKSTVGTATNSDASGYTVGYLQGLSKTTTAYVAYSVMSQGTAINTYSVLGNALGGGALTLGGSSSVIALGLNKKF